jgi:molecular chaperone GrpE (heat shock protein)
VTVESVGEIAESAVRGSSNSELRAQLMAQFEKWLDQALLDEPAPRGLPEQILDEAIASVTEEQTAPEADLYTLFSAMTGLTGEIKLQGRSFKQLSDLLSPLSETPALLAQLREAQLQSDRSIQALLESQKEQEEEPVQFKQVCDVMIDLYDRLRRGLNTCDQAIRSLQSRPKPGWVRRLFSAPDAVEQATRTVQGMREAGALTLARLEAALQEWGVRRIGAVGDPFDPARMTAIEARATREVKPGTVLVVQRSGYSLNGVLKATAQVTVSKEQVGE